MLDNILKSASALGACERLDKVKNFHSLTSLFFTPQGLEFCHKNNFPPLGIFQAHKNEVSVIEIKGGGIWLKAAANLSVCKDQGGCAVIYNEQRKQEERDNLELRNLKISRREAHWAIALAIISICASQFWGHTIFEWTWIAMQKISKLLF